MPTSRPAIVIVLDDLISSGRTMELSLEAIRQAGVMAFGMAFSGH
jgi:adenine/guanine phosphoribosyltransferase-like PRPP-binding protein